MMLIRPFDPWKSALCTCPEKYSLNPYTGCSHGCIYCYSTYIPDFYRLRLKKNLLGRVEKDLSRLPDRSLISMSNSSDPYPPVEEKLGLTRKVLELIRNHNQRVMIVTKSDLVCRDLNLISELDAAVSVSITTLDKEKVKKLEPGAPEPIERIKALKKLHSEGIPCILRLDPVIPGVTEDEIEKIIEECSFVSHVVSSTLKLRFDSLKRISRAFPGLEYRRLYRERIQNSFYLPRSLRLELLGRVRDACKNYGLSYAFCREGLPFKARSCDGSHLIR
jgi:DNA repair photolyase